MITKKHNIPDELVAQLLGNYGSLVLEGAAVDDTCHTCSF
ncbi:MAG: hypothetical protein H6R01_153 [Burkholderiaceae bacterium]|nr:hypothetical protein [Burkholderiaceae bacterium]